MAVDKAFLMDLSPEFETVDSGRIDRLVALASLQVVPRVWGLKADLAVALLVAHWIAAGSKSLSGEVQREEIGDIKVTYATGNAKGSDTYDSTTWGAQYKALGRSIVRGPIVT